jgi:hypothetical protein
MGPIPVTTQFIPDQQYMRSSIKSEPYKVPQTDMVSSVRCEISGPCCHTVHTEIPPAVQIALGWAIGRFGLKQRSIHGEWHDVSGC